MCTNVLGTPSISGMRVPHDRNDTVSRNTDGTKEENYANDVFELPSSLNPVRQLYSRLVTFPE